MSEWYVNKYAPNLSCHKLVPPPYPSWVPQGWDWVACGTTYPAGGLIPAPEGRPRCKLCERKEP